MTSTDKQDLYQAIIAAFSLVSYADGLVHMSELSQLVKIFKADGLFKDVTAEQLQKDITEHVAVLSDDPDKKHLASHLASVGKIKDDGRARDLVLRICRLTLMADGRVTESENKILADINRTLGTSAL